ncbi:MAG: VOC family protein [Actinobacteria bacterium]|nr:MAG: VOC family protein [Actinomycetota bacterium]
MSLIGAPIWADLAASDMNAERSFYAGLLGWEYGESHPDAGGWIMATAEGKPAAGMAPRPAQMPVSSWTVYFGCTDIDAAVARATQLGATVYMPPMSVDVGGVHMCSIAVLADPGGAVFGLSEPGEHKGFGLTSGRGSVAWYELLSRDLDAATDFYRELLGAKVTKADVPMDYRLVGVAEGADFAGLMAMPDEVPAEAPSYWSIYFEVDDAAAAVDFASESGATVIFGPQTMPDIGTIANVLDPEHAAVSVLEPPRGE